MKRQFSLLVPRVASVIAEAFRFFMGLLRARRTTAQMMILVFCLAAIGGMLLPNSSKLSLFTGLLDKFSDMEGQTHEITFVQIFWNNFSVSFYAFLLSIFLIPAWIIVVVNGFLLGIFLDFLWKIGQISSLTAFVGGIISLLPHGIIELPVALSACFLSYLMGVKLYHRHAVMPKMRRWRFFLRSLLVLMVLITPLLLIASIIETYVSPVISLPLARTTLAKQRSDATLVAKLLTPQELQSVGIDAQREPLVDLQHEDAFLLSKKLAVYIYDDRVFAGMKVALPDSFEQKAYRVGSDEHLVDSLDQYDSVGKMRRGLSLYIDVLHVMVDNDPGLRLDQTEALSFIVRRGEKPVYYRFGFKGRVLCYATYKGSHPELLKDVVDLQVGKLK